MLEAGLKALKECTCNVQPLQELACEATLKLLFGRDDQRHDDAHWRRGRIDGQDGVARQSCNSPWHTFVGQRCDRAE